MYTRYDSKDLSGLLLAPLRRALMDVERLLEVELDPARLPEEPAVETLHMTAAALDRRSHSSGVGPDADPPDKSIGDGEDHRPRRPVRTDDGLAQGASTEPGDARITRRTGETSRRDVVRTAPQPTRQDATGKRGSAFTQQERERHAEGSGREQRPSIRLVPRLGETLRTASSLAAGDRGTTDDEGLPRRAGSAFSSSAAVPLATGQWESQPDTQVPRATRSALRSEVKNSEAMPPIDTRAMTDSTSDHASWRAVAHPACGDADSILRVATPTVADVASSERCAEAPPERSASPDIFTSLPRQEFQSAPATQGPGVPLCARRPQYGLDQHSGHRPARDEYHQPGGWNNNQDPQYEARNDPPARTLPVAAATWAAALEPSLAKAGELTQVQTGGAATVRNVFNVKVTLNGGEGQEGIDPLVLQQAFTDMLIASARRHGLDI